MSILFTAWSKSNRRNASAPRRFRAIGTEAIDAEVGRTAPRLAQAVGGRLGQSVLRVKLPRGEKAWRRHLSAGEGPDRVAGNLDSERRRMDEPEHVLHLPQHTLGRLTGQDTAIKPDSDLPRNQRHGRIRITDDIRRNKKAAAKIRMPGHWY